MRAGLLLPGCLVLSACAPAWLDVTEGPGLRGPGGPARTFEADELFTGCAWLNAQGDTWYHHNLVMPYRGHLVLPWSPEWGTGGLSFFDVSDPCEPVRVGEGTARAMRETHAIAFLHLPDDDPHAGEYAVTNATNGILVWDLSELEAPEPLAELVIEDVVYAFDAYARVVLAVSWQHPTLYVAAADNGLLIVDTSDPSAPRLVDRVQVDPPLRAGGVFTLGNRLLLTSAEQEEAVVLDISDPHRPQPILGGRFTTTDADGEPREHYHANLSGHTALFARKERGGGVLAVDLTDPSQPTRIGEAWTGEGGGGYVFADEGHWFLGNSDFGVVFDATDPSAPVEIGRMAIEGDNDTLTPYGNVAILSADGEARTAEASAVVPWTADPDTTPPRVIAVDPADGATGVALTARVGLGLDEIVEPASAFVGSVRLSTEGGRPVPGWVSTQEAQVAYVPKEPLEPDTTYVVEVLAGGLADIDGNTLGATVTTRFTTAGAGAR